MPTGFATGHQVLLADGPQRVGCSEEGGKRAKPFDRNEITPPFLFLPPPLAHGHLHLQGQDHLAF